MFILADILYVILPAFNSLFSTFQHFHGLEEAVYRNIKACKELTKTTQSAFGPHGKSFSH